MLTSAEDEDFADILAGGPVRGWRLAHGGVETDDVITMLRELAADVRSAFQPAAWLIIEDDCVVGLCSLLQPPGPSGELKIGYGVAPSWRRRGVARRAIAALVEWGTAQAEIAAITAETGVDNLASQRALECNGFARIGTRRDDEDGALLIWWIDTRGA